MTFINKDKVLHGVEKAVDGANCAAEHAEQFVKDNQIDQKIDSVKCKAENFMKETGIDQKINSAVDKTENFIKTNEIDKKAQKAVNTIGHGMKTAGERMEKAFSKQDSDSNSDSTHTF